jgi:hypothetical protein
MTIAELHGKLSQALDAIREAMRRCIGLFQRSKSVAAECAGTHEDGVALLPKHLPHKSFPGLQECVAYIRKKHPQSVMSVRGWDMNSGTALGWRASYKYLFRGEAGLYPTTFNGLERLRRQPDAEVCYMIAEDARQHIIADTCQRLGLSAMEVEGFCQHYGLPTRMHDYSSDLDIAVFFACHRGGAEELSPGDQAMLCVLPTRKAPLKIAHLGRNPIADRATRQAAFGVLADRHVDLKSERACKKIKLKWYQVTLQSDDLEQWRKSMSEEKRKALDNILNAMTDNFAGWMALCLDDFFVNCHVHSDEDMEDIKKAMQVLYARVDRTPFAMKMIDPGGESRPAVCETMAPEELKGMKIDPKRPFDYDEWLDEHRQDIAKKNRELLYGDKHA